MALVEHWVYHAAQDVDAFSARDNGSDSAGAKTYLSSARSSYSRLRLRRRPPPSPSSAATLRSGKVTTAESFGKASTLLGIAMALMKCS